MSKNHTHKLDIKYIGINNFLVSIYEFYIAVYQIFLYWDETGCTMKEIAIWQFMCEPVEHSMGLTQFKEVFLIFTSSHMVQYLLFTCNYSIWRVR